MLDAAHRIVADPNDLAGPTKVLLEHQDDFLLGMDDIVSAYDRDAGQRVAHVSSVERALLGAALLTLFLEGLLVFAPLVRGVRRACAVLTRTQSALEASLVEQKQLDLKIIETADRERRKLGEDLHDGLCQHLVGVSYLLRAVKPAAEGDAGKRLEEATGLVEEAVDQARHLAKGLHPVGVDQYGLAAALEELGEAVETTFGLPCDVQCDTLEGIQPDVATQLFRIAQEAVANAAKHASAKHLEVSARRRNGELWLEIADDGVGLDPNAKRNMGLYTMSSRASMIASRDGRCVIVGMPCFTIQFASRPPLVTRKTVLQPRCLAAACACRTTGLPSFSLKG
jgi:signal transduction histidine kinase